MPEDDHTSLAAPVAERRPTVLTHHGDSRTDDWYWLRDAEDPAVIAHLEAENAHTEAVLAPHAQLCDELFEEIRGRILETDISPPVPWGAFQYRARTEEGKQYAIHLRQPRGAAEGTDETVLLDENVEAGAHDFFDLGAFEISPDHHLAAWAADVTGRERYTIRVRDLRTGTDLADEIPDTAGGIAWYSDNRTLLYTRKDEAERPHQAWRHTLGTPVSDDVLVFEEADERFFLGVSRTTSDAFLVIHLASSVTSEVWVGDAVDPTGPFRVVEPRRQDVEYTLDHSGEHFYLVTNDEAENFKLVSAPIATPGRAHWTDVVPHRADVKLDAIAAFADHLVLYERSGGITRIAVRAIASGDTHVVDQPEEIYTVFPGANPEFETTTLRFGYTSMVTPSSVYDYDVRTRERTLVKRQPVLGGFDPERWVTYRLWATAPGGTEVPISVVHARDLDRSVPHRCLLYGYGSYEISIDPTFSSARLSLLERDWVFAIAHPRGGGEMGRRWYEDGKYEHKPNTFSDTVACAEKLIAEGLTSPGQLAVRGGSAGGLLVGATVNLRPDLFAAAVAEVPFVDVLTTMLDESIPLTVIEFEQWGNPKEPAVYERLKAYSPIDNVKAEPYPAMLVTAGLTDPRVGFWEPAKWVQKLRAVTTGDKPILFKCRLGAGHAGPSGRYDAWKEEAFVYSFLLTHVPEA